MDRRVKVLAVAAVAGLVVLSACSTSSPPSSGSESVPLIGCGGAATVTYASHPGVDPVLNSLDVHLPAAAEDGCANAPLVVWVHGGAWHEGDKTDHIEDKVRLFTGAGYAFASVNYRLTDRSTDPPSPQHPVHDQDVADALAWLIDHAGDLGVDPERVAALGHSAGGGIVAAIATDDSYLGRHDLGLDSIRCAGSVDGEGYDITVGAEHPDPRVHEPYRDAFGDDAAVWKGASPLEHIARGTSIPDYVVVARGPSGRLDLHREFVAALRGAGVPVTVVDAGSLDHAQVSTEIGRADDDIVTPVLMSFLADCFSSR